MQWILINGAQHCFFITIIPLKAAFSPEALSQIRFQIIRRKLIWRGKSSLEILKVRGHKIKPKSCELKEIISLPQ